MSSQCVTNFYPQGRWLNLYVYVNYHIGIIAITILCA